VNREEEGSHDRVSIPVHPISPKRATDKKSERNQEKARKRSSSNVAADLHLLPHRNISTKKWCNETYIIDIKRKQALVRFTPPSSLTFVRRKRVMGSFFANLIATSSSLDGSTGTV
jgi:hypothetical protein